MHFRLRYIMEGIRLELGKDETLKFPFGGKHAVVVTILRLVDEANPAGTKLVCEGVCERNVEPSVQEGFRQFTVGGSLDATSRVLFEIRPAQPMPKARKLVSKTAFRSREKRAANAQNLVAAFVDVVCVDHPSCCGPCDSHLSDGSTELPLAESLGESGWRQALRVPEITTAFQKYRPLCAERFRLGLISHEHGLVATHESGPNLFNLSTQCSAAAVRRSKLKEWSQPVRNEKSAEVLPAKRLQAVIKCATQDRGQHISELQSERARRVCELSLLTREQRGVQARGLIYRRNPVNFAHPLQVTRDLLVISRDPVTRIEMRIVRPGQSDERLPRKVALAHRQNESRPCAFHLRDRPVFSVDNRRDAS